MSLETEQYLQKVSQCLHNINEIINAFVIKPIKLDKELDKFYVIERNKLIKLIKEHVGVLDVKELNKYLSDNLVFHNNGTELLKKQTDDSLNYLSIISSKLQHQRDLGSLIPHTGIEEGPLKDFLEKYLSKKNLNEGKNTNNLTTKIKNSNKITVGPFMYENEIVYYNNSIIEKLSPQAVKLCYLFFINKDKFISYENIQSELSDSDYITKENMQKVISKVRSILKSKTHKNLINNMPGKGYSFSTKEIL